MKPIPKEDLDLIRDAALACGYIPVEHHAREFTAIHVKHNAASKQRYWNPLQPSTGHLAEVMALCSIELSTDTVECDCVEAYCYDCFHGYNVSYGRAVTTFEPWNFDQNEASLQARIAAICRCATLAAAMKTRFGANRHGQVAHHAPDGFDRVIVVEEHARNLFLIALRDLGVQVSILELKGSNLDAVKARQQYAPFHEESSQAAIYFNCNSNIEDAVLATIQHFGPKGDFPHAKFPFNLYDYQKSL